MTSLLVKILRPSVATACRSSVGMQSLSVRMYGFGSHVSDNDPEVMERAQKRHLEGKTKSRFPEEAPGWEEELASDSEAIVKAERVGEKSMKKLQEETVKCLQDERGEGAGGTPGFVQQRP